MPNDFKLPKTQIVWVTYTKNNKPTHIITSDYNRLKYFLYEVDNRGNTKRIASSKEPIFAGFNS